MKINNRTHRITVLATGFCALCATTPTQALVYDLPIGGDEALKAILNTTVTIGAGIRTQARSADLIGKSNLDPQVCTGPNGAWQSCQGLFRTQLFPAQHLARAPGAASLNNDDGDLNYGRGEVFSAPAKLTQDLGVAWGHFGLFGRWLYFYDAVNDHFTENHPNRITPDNRLQAGRLTPSLRGSGLTADSLISVSRRPAAANPIGTALVEWRPYGQPVDGGYLVYGPGAHVRSTRSDPATLREAGSAAQYLDGYIHGQLPLWGERTLGFRLGRQTLSWGEATTLVVNGISQANPINANNFYRIGQQTEEIFIPVSMLQLSTQLTEGISAEGFYQLEWQGTQSVAPGSYFSDLDIGTGDIGRTVSSNGGGVAEDPQRIATPLDSPLAGSSNTTSTIRRLPDLEPHTAGQFGLAFKYYAETLLNGTEFGLYYLNYHSRLPLASVYAANPGCLRAQGNPLGIDANNFATALQACPDIPLVHSLLTGQPAQYATSNQAPLDTPYLQFEYPENIRLAGASFNTTLGAWSLQGEVAWRPNQPLQIATTDLQFAAFGPTLSRCFDPALHCSGTGGPLPNFGYAADGSVMRYGASDFIDANGRNPYPDTFPQLIGAMPGSARAFPNFVIPYRGGRIGENPGCPADLAPDGHTPANPCYIRGYERLSTWNVDFSAARVLGRSDNVIAADQILGLIEVGATWVPGLPPLDQLQFQAPGVFYSATAGADGSGADGSRQACSASPDCSFGADGLRFNPHQADLSAFPDRLSWGYRLITRLSYENVLPSLGLHPTLSWAQDVQGTSPGPGGNFIAGRKQTDLLIEARYRSSWSLNVGYTWYFGAGPYNPLHDRDFAQVFLKVQF